MPSTSSPPSVTAPRVYASTTQSIWASVRAAPSRLAAMTSTASKGSTAGGAAGTVTGFLLHLWLLEWLRTSMIERGMIAASDPDLLHVVDEAEAAVDYVVSAARRLRDGRAGA